MKPTCVPSDYGLHQNQRKMGSDISNKMQNIAIEIAMHV